MRKRLLPLGLAALTTAVLAAPVVAQEPAAPPASGERTVHFDLGVRASSLQQMNASDSYDAVFDGEAMTLVGVQFEFAIDHLLIALAYETGEVDGQQVLPTNPPIPIGIEETLTLSPLHATFGWIFAPESSVHGFIGLGPTLLDWEDEGGANSASGSDIGFHAVTGLRWSTPGHRFTVGGEVRYSSIPDAIGDAGISRVFDEDDLGGLTVGASLLFRAF